MLLKIEFINNTGTYVEKKYIEYSAGINVEIPTDAKRAVIKIYEEVEC